MKRLGLTLLTALLVGCGGSPEPAIDWGADREPRGAERGDSAPVGSGVAGLTSLSLTVSHFFCHLWI